MVAWGIHLTTSAWLLALPVLAVAADNSLPRHMTTVVHVDQRSGRLVRKVEIVPKMVASRQTADDPEPEKLLGLQQMIDTIADEHGVEGPLVHSVIRAESNYNPLALSPKGAQGLMQLIPSTARRFGVQNSFDPQENIRGGVKYLKFLLDYYKGDYEKAIAAYNAGEEAVDRYHGIPPYAETRNYVYQVARNLKAARLKQAKAAEAKPPEEPAGEQAETPRPIQASLGSDGKIYYRNP